MPATANTRRENRLSPWLVRVLAILLPFTPACEKEYWDPSTVVPIEKHERLRDYRLQRGVIHLHSIHSHDACDHDPCPGGEPNWECTWDLRRDMCEANLQFVTITEHADNYAWFDFPEVLLYNEAFGDWLVHDAQGNPYANIVHCQDGNQVILVSGHQNGLMSLFLRRMPEGTPEERHELFRTVSPEAVQAFRDLGAQVFIPYSDEWETADVLAMPVDGIELYNICSNINPDNRIGMGLPPLDWIATVLEFIFPLTDPGHPDLAFLTFFGENTPGLKHFTVSMGQRRTVGYVGNDVHRNSLPFDLWDGDRADSYRRLMRWAENYVLVKEMNVDALEEAVGRGRMFGAFPVFGEPMGFDYHATNAAAQIAEMGDTLSLSAGGTVLHLKAPRLYGIDASFPRPELLVRLIRSTADGGEVVAEKLNADIDYPVTEANAYRAEVRIVPHHLERWLGNDPGPMMKEYPYIYSNPIYITP